MRVGVDSEIKWLLDGQREGTGSRGGRVFDEMKFGEEIGEAPIPGWENSVILRFVQDIGRPVDEIRKALKGATGCKVEICAIDEEEAQATAKRLRQVFASCGFLVDMMREEDNQSEGLRLETNSRNAAAALAIQSAFHQARVDTTLLLQDSGPRDVVVLRLGRHGLS